MIHPMDCDEAVRIIKLLANRPWVKHIEPIPERWLSIETTDGEMWKIESPLSYARLLYHYECEKQWS